MLQRCRHFVGWWLQVFATTPTPCNLLAGGLHKRRGMEEAVAPETCSSCVPEVSTDQPVAEAFGAAPVHQSVLTTAEADAATATFSLPEFRIFFQGLVISGNRYSAIIAVLKHKESGMVSSCSAAAAPAADEGKKEEEQVLTPQQLRNKAEEDAKAKVIEALASIDNAENTCGGLFAEWFNFARENLEDCTDPLAAGAAAAQNIIHYIMMKCPCGKKKALKKAAQDIRDVVVLRCRALCKDPKDRDGFLEQAARAYGSELDKEVRAQLLLAYHKDRTGGATPALNHVPILVFVHMSVFGTPARSHSGSAGP